MSSIEKCGRTLLGRAEKKYPFDGSEIWRSIVFVDVQKLRSRGIFNDWLADLRILPLNSLKFETTNSKSLPKSWHFKPGPPLVLPQSWHHYVQKLESKSLKKFNRWFVVVAALVQALKSHSLKGGLYKHQF